MQGERNIGDLANFTYNTPNERWTTFLNIGELRRELLLFAGNYKVPKLRIDPGAFVLPHYLFIYE